MEKAEKKYEIISPKGVKYLVGETKAKAMVKKFDCKWVGDEPAKKESPDNVPEDSEKPKRKRRTKAEIEAENNKE